MSATGPSDMAFTHRLRQLLATACNITVCVALALVGTSQPARAQPSNNGPPVARVPSNPKTEPVDDAETSTQTTTTLRVVVFVGFTPVSGAQLQQGGVALATTSSEGVAQFQLQPGTYQLKLQIPARALPDSPDEKWVDLPSFTLGSRSVEALVNLSPDGSLESADFEGTEDAAVQEKAPEPEAAVVTGQVQGRVVSPEDKKGIAQATVIVRGVTREATTDAQGDFTISVPVGRQAISVIHPNFSTETASDVVVKEDQIAQLTVELSPAATQLEDVVVTAPYIQGGVAQMLDKRQESSSVTDAIGADDIKRSPDSTAGAATRRIVGASVVGGSFLFVRGLGGRYSNVRLNGVSLPSTDPDLPGFQIDLFPSSLLSSLTITKTFSPDMPADFAGGSLNVETKAFPESFQVSASASVKYNTETTGRQMLTYDGGSTDFLAMDDGTRALPSEVPNEQVTPVRRGEGLTDDDVIDIARSFKNNWKRQRTTALPSLSLGFNVGDTLSFDGSKLGYLLTGGYRLNYSRYKETLRNVSISGVGDDAELGVRETLKREVGKEEAQIGLLGTISYAMSQNHSARIVSMLTKTAEDTTSRVTGFSENENAPMDFTSYRFIERQLLFNQLLGKHALFDGLELEWQLNSATVERQQPDSREMFYLLLTESYQFGSSPANGQHLFTELGQTDFGGGLDLTLSRGPADVKTGYVVRTSSREFSARRFGTTFAGTVEDRFLPPEELFEPENYGAVLTFDESTRPDDGYQADEDLHAGYLMADGAVLDWLRLLGGVRAEAFAQSISVATPFSTDEPQVAGSDRSDLDWLPAAAAVFSLRENMNVRLAYGGTVARPQVRELAPFLSQDFVRRRNVQGNPNLKRTLIHNYDARWEFFPSGTEVLATSVFYKRFVHPIESVVKDARGNVTYENTEGAENYGAEFELRLSFGRLSDDLNWLSSGMNFAWIESQIILSDEQATLGGSTNRPLAGQSPYVANLLLGVEPEGLPLSTFLFYNVFGRRIDEVGRVGLPDTYEQPFHSLDWTGFWDMGAGFTLGASVTNLLNQKAVFKQGSIEVVSVERGLDVGLSLGWKNAEN